MHNEYIQLSSSAVSKQLPKQMYTFNTEKHMHELSELCTLHHSITHIPFHCSHFRVYRCYSDQQGEGLWGGQSGPFSLKYDASDISIFLHH